MMKINIYQLLCKHKKYKSTYDCAKKILGIFICDCTALYKKQKWVLLLRDI